MTRESRIECRVLFEFGNVQEQERDNASGGISQGGKFHGSPLRWTKQWPVRDSKQTVQNAGSERFLLKQTSSKEYTTQLNFICTELLMLFRFSFRF
jgi:hypothetical protein